MLDPFNGDPELSHECEEFHATLRAEMERQAGPVADWRDDYISWIEACVEFDRVLRAASKRPANADIDRLSDPAQRVEACAELDAAFRAERERIKAPTDTVPIAKEPVNLSEVNRRVRGARLRFQAVEVTENGVKIIDEPVALAMVNWPDTDSKPGMDRPE